MKLYITDEGDPSVGVFSKTYEIDTPFHPDNVYPDDLIWFKRQMETVYKEFAEGRLTMWYENECDIDPDEPDDFECLFQCVKDRMSQ